MLLLALPQIYIHVFHLWKSIDLDSAWLRYSRTYQLSLFSNVLACLEMHHTRVLGVGVPSNAYLTFQRCTFGPPQIYTRVFHLWKSIDFDSAWVRDSRPYQLTFLSYVLKRIEMRHTRVLIAGVPTNAHLTF